MGGLVMALVATAAGGRKLGGDGIVDVHVEEELVLLTQALGCRNLLVSLFFSFDMMVLLSFPS
jgi:hypothetical protein